MARFRTAALALALTLGLGTCVGLSACGGARAGPGPGRGRASAADPTASASSAPTAPAPSAPSATDPWTGAGIVAAPGGRYLTDARGRRLQLHGVDLAAKCGGGAVPQPAAGTPCVGPATGSQPAFVLSPTAADPGRRFTGADAATLARLGVTVVRLGIVWEGLEPGPRGAGPNDPAYCAPHAAGTPYPALGAADPYDARVLAAYLTRTDAIVSELARQGIRVIVDMHQDAFGSAFSDARGDTPWNGEGAPPWATCTDHAPFGTVSTWGQANRRPAVEAADHHFYANDVRGDLQGQFVEVWQSVARHFRGDPDVLGYELLNEPADFSQPRFDPELQCDYGGPAHEPASCATSGAQALPDGWIGAIQDVDPAHVVFYEPPIYNFFGARERIGIDEPLRVRNVGFAFHLYHPPSVIASLIERERAATRTDQPGGPPAIMDEFGGSRHAAGAAADVAQAGRLGISWSYWSALELHDPTGNPAEYLLDQATRRPVPAKARALAVAYPFATAGTPRAESWSPPARRLRYRYAVDRAVRAPTEIVVPPYTYPRGYRATVTGATVESRPGARILMLTPRPGATTVSVTVSPR